MQGRDTHVNGNLPLNPNSARSFSVKAVPLLYVALFRSACPRRGMLSCLGIPDLVDIVMQRMAFAEGIRSVSMRCGCALLAAHRNATTFETAYIPICVLSATAMSSNELHKGQYSMRIVRLSYRVTSFPPHEERAIFEPAYGILLS